MQRLRLGLGLGIGHHSGRHWTQQYYILKSGTDWYKREINRAGGYFKLWYSDDSGVTWDDLMTLDLTESSVIIDLPHTYRHSIVDGAYNVDWFNGGVWENLYSTGTWTSQAKTFFTRATIPFNKKHKIRLNNLYDTLTNSTVFNKLDVLLVSNKDLQTSLLNLITGRNDSALIGALTHNKNIGFSNPLGAANLAWDTGFNPAVNGVKYLLNDASWGVFIGNNPVDTGYCGSAYKTPNISSLKGRVSGTQLSYSVNSASEVVLNNVPNFGLHNMIRRDNANTIFIRSLENEVSSSKASSGLPNINFYLNCLNNNGVIQDVTTKEIKAFYAGANLSQAEAWFLYNALYTYLYTDQILCCSLGDSTISGWTPQAYDNVTDLINIDGDYGFYDLSHSGDTINNQKTKWDALDTIQQNTLKYVFVEVGLNDLNPAESAVTALGRYQALINDIRGKISATCEIITCTMTPCKAYLIATYGGVDGLTAYQKWLDMNDAIKGNGANAITGMDDFVYTHTDSLNDGSGNLAAIYDTGDGIHENNVARAVIATAWKLKLP
jgi:hypothetical protein